MQSIDYFIHIIKHNYCNLLFSSQLYFREVDDELLGIHEMSGANVSDMSCFSE